MAPARMVPVRIDQSRPGKYARSFQALDGAIYVLGVFKVTEQGRKVGGRDDSDPSWPPTALSESRINTFFSRPGFFLGLRSRLKASLDGAIVGTMWRSFDGLKTIREEETRLLIPEAGQVDFGRAGEWAGLVFHRAVVESTDGSLLAAMYGNFEQDRTRPTNPHSKRETKYKLRAFLVRSSDQGETWRYLATVAAPSPDVADDSEGFNEWSMVRLADGRLLGVIRTGHFTPLVASWSRDDGRSWTPPQTPLGLGPGGCDPYLLKLQDGRLALAYGEMVQPPADRERYWREYTARAEPRRRCRLALSADGTGRAWQTLDVCDYDERSAYPTIFEVAPNLLLYQSDLQLWRVELPPASEGVAPEFVP